MAAVVAPACERFSRLLRLAAKKMFVARSCAVVSSGIICINHSLTASRCFFRTKLE